MQLVICRPSCVRFYVGSCGYIARISEMKNVPEFYAEYVNGRQHVGRHRHRWQNDIKVGWKE